MRILSWDVGIKNLAYCLIDSNDKINIVEWGIINLLEESNCRCYGFINSDNSKNKCTKKPLYEYVNGLDKYYFLSTS